MEAALIFMDNHPVATMVICYLFVAMNLTFLLATQGRHVRLPPDEGA